MLSSIAAIAFAFQAGSVSADAATAAPPPAPAPEAIVVQGTRHPELKRYRVMLAGLDAFAVRHELAPQASVLRFVLRPRRNVQGATLDGLTLRIDSDDGAIPLTVGADGAFVLPRSQAADDADADMVINKRKGSIGWTADVRSAGVPPGMRRLGDLRLECQVEVAIAKKELNFFQRAAVNTFTLGRDWCGLGYGHYFFDAPDGAVAANLILADHSQAKVLAFNPGEGSYEAPIASGDWPDDALVEFRFVGGNAAASGQP